MRMYIVFKLANIFTRPAKNEDYIINIPTKQTDMPIEPNGEKFVKVTKEDNYEDELSHYGPAKDLSSILSDQPICWLLLADTHGNLNIGDIKQYSEYPYTAIILLGDHSVADLQRLIMCTDKNMPIYLIKGNHDENTLLEDFTQFSPDRSRVIQDISNSVVNIDGINVACLAGAYKYKECSRCMYTQEESLQIADELSTADICFAHSNPYLYQRNDLSHSGLKGVTKYVYKNQIPLLVHGHIHTPGESLLRNGTMVHSIYKTSIIVLDKTLPNSVKLSVASQI